METSDIWCGCYEIGNVCVRYLERGEGGGRKFEFVGFISI